MSRTNQKTQLPFVFISGWSFQSSVWDDFICSNQLSNAICIDLPYLNQPELDKHSVDQVCQIIAEQIPENAILIGWSLGALLAIKLASQSTHIQKICLIGSTPCFSAKHNWQGVELDSANEFKYNFKRFPQKTLRRFAMQVQEPNNDADIKKKLLKHQFDATHQLSLMHYLDLLFESDLRTSFDSLNCPILQIHGEFDTVVSKNQPEQSLEIIKQAGHAPFITHPSDVANCLMRFI